MFQRVLGVAGWLIIFGLTASLCFNAFKAVTTNARLVQCLKIQHWLLSRSSGRSGAALDDHSIAAAGSVNVQGLLDLAEAAGIKIAPYDSSKYEEGDEIFRQAVRLSQDIGQELGRHQTDALKAMFESGLALLAVSACVCIQGQFLKSSAPPPSIAHVPGTLPERSLAAEKTIEQFSRDVGKIQDSVFRSINISQSGLRSTLVQSPVGIILLKDDRSLDYVNQSIIELGSYTPKSLVGRKFDELVKIGDHDFDWQKLPARDVEAVIEAEDGRAIPVELSISAVESSSRKKFIVNVVDVSARAELMRIRKDTLAEVSHDLQTPLTSLKLFLSMIVDGSYGELPSSASDALNRVLPQLDRLLRLTRNMLSAEEIDSGILKLHIQPARLSELLNLAVASMEGTAKIKNQQISVSVESMDQSNIECLIDPERLAQVLVNLLSNAVKFSPKNSRILVSARRENDTVTIEVVDEGPGISARDAESIFEKFERTSVSEAGTGIGLWVCRRIVELHGGAVGARARTDRSGSVFWVVLPGLSAAHNSLPEESRA